MTSVSDPPSIQTTRVGLTKRSFGTGSLSGRTLVSEALSSCAGIGIAVDSDPVPSGTGAWGASAGRSAAAASFSDMAAFTSRSSRNHTSAVSLGKLRTTPVLEVSAALLCSYNQQRPSVLQVWCGAKSGCLRCRGAQDPESRNSSQKGNEYDQCRGPEGRCVPFARRHKGPGATRLVFVQNTVSLKKKYRVEREKGRVR